MYINNKDILLLSANTMKNKSTLNRNVEDNFIISAVKTAQDVHLVNLIGRELVHTLCEKVSTNTLTGDYLTLVNEYLTDYLINVAMSVIQVPLWSKIRQEGVVQQNGTEQTTISKNELAYTQEHYMSLANGLISGITTFLDAHKDTIPEWKDKCSKNISYQTHIVL